MGDKEQRIIMKALLGSDFERESPLKNTKQRSVLEMWRRGYFIQEIGKKNVPVKKRSVRNWFPVLRALIESVLSSWIKIQS